MSAGVGQSLQHPTVADQGKSAERQSYQTLSLYPTTKGRSREHSRNRAGFGVGRRAETSRKMGKWCHGWPRTPRSSCEQLRRWIMQFKTGSMRKNLQFLRMCRSCSRKERHRRNRKESTGDLAWEMASQETKTGAMEWEASIEKERRLAHKRKAGDVKMTVVQEGFSDPCRDQTWSSGRARHQRPRHGR